MTDQERWNALRLRIHHNLYMSDRRDAELLDKLEPSEGQTDADRTAYRERQRWAHLFEACARTMDRRASADPKVVEALRNVAICLRDNVLPLAGSREDEGG